MCGRYTDTVPLVVGTKPSTGDLFRLTPLVTCAHCARAGTWAHKQYWNAGLHLSTEININSNNRTGSDASLTHTYSTNTQKCCGHSVDVFYTRAFHGHWCAPELAHNSHPKSFAIIHEIICINKAYCFRLCAYCVGALPSHPKIHSWHPKLNSGIRANWQCGTDIMALHLSGDIVFSINGIFASVRHPKQIRVLKILERKNSKIIIERFTMLYEIFEIFTHRVPSLEPIEIHLLSSSLNHFNIGNDIRPNLWRNRMNSQCIIFSSVIISIYFCWQSALDNFMIQLNHGRSEHYQTIHKEQQLLLLLCIIYQSTSSHYKKEALLFRALGVRIEESKKRPNNWMNMIPIRQDSRKILPLE